MLNIGDEIKDYTLVKFLGKGGFGEVWLAEKKIELADKTVPFALKFLAGQNSGGMDVETVKREVNTWIAASGNKQVISVLDGFMYGEIFVIVSEYADGGSLRDWIKTNGGKSLSIEKAVDLMGGILDGLTHLHSQKIIHRDLKPENILLKGDVPCIADFGVSRVVETLSLGDAFGTNSAGSPHYMSPESFERITPSPQVDIWSAGVILYEMLCGKFPYQAETVPGLVIEIITKDPKPMPDEVPREIQQVVKKALSKHVDERFASAKEMRDELLRAFYLQSQTVTIKDEVLQETRQSAGIFMKEKTQSDIATLRQGFTESPARNYFSLGFIATYAIAGLILLVGAVGLVSWGLMRNRTIAIPEKSIIENQNTSVTPKTDLPETVQANSNTKNPDVTSSTDLVPTNSDEKPKVAAPQTPEPKTVPKRTETIQAKPKQTTNSKKKTTLDDLLNK